MKTHVGIIRKIGESFVFDATLSERHSYRTVITDNPVETGSMISDHAYSEPAQLEIKATVGVINSGEVDIARPSRALDDLLLIRGNVS